MKSYKVKKTFVASAAFTQATGHNLYALLSLSAVPAAIFSFRSNVVEWPGMNHEQAVRTGILEVLADAGAGGGQTAEFVLKTVSGNRSESHWDAYYEAAKRATVMILRQIDGATSR